MASRTTVRSEIDDLRTDLAALREDLRDLAGAVKRAGGNAIHRAGQSASRFAENGVDMVRETAAKVGRQVERAEEAARDGISSHPWWSVLGAVGVGLLAGRFLARD